MVHAADLWSILLPELAVELRLTAVIAGVHTVGRLAIEAVLLVEVLLHERRRHRIRLLADRVHLRDTELPVGRRRLILARIEAATDVLRRLLLHRARRELVPLVALGIQFKLAQNLVTIAVAVVDVEDVARPEFGGIALFLRRAATTGKNVNIELFDILKRHSLVFKHFLNSQLVAAAAVVQRPLLYRTLRAEFVVNHRSTSVRLLVSLRIRMVLNNLLAERRARSVTVAQVNIRHFFG